MKQDEMKKLTDSIQQKLGKDAVGIIADDLGKIITDNAQMNTEIENRDNKIKGLESDKELLTTTNGRLLQQVTMGEETPRNTYKNNEEKQEKPKPFSFKSIFDEKGNFKK